MTTRRTLILRLGEDDTVDWLLQRPGESPRLGRGGLADAAAQLQGGQLVVLVPAADVLLTSARIPGRAQRVRQAVPYVLEEQLAEEVEGLHFALGRRDKEQRLPVAVVSRARLTDWLKRLEAAELRPQRMLSEAQALPWRPGQWSLLLGTEGALLRFGEAEAAHLDVELLPELLPRMLEAANEARPQRLAVYTCEGAGEAGLGELPEGVEVQRQTCRQHLAVLAEGLGQSGADINLLQGEFSRQEQLGRLWRPWRAAVALFLVWVLIQAVEAIYDYRSLSAREVALSAQIEQLYLRTFPDARKVVDPRLQMSRRLEALRSGGEQGGLIPLLAQVGPVLSGQAGTELRSLRYREGALELELALKDLPSLDRLKQELSDGGLQVDIRSAASRGGSVESRLEIRGVGA